MNKNERNGKSSRREFMKSTAFTAAGAVVGSYALQNNVHAQGQEKEVKAPGGPNERVNMGLIGTGGMGSDHLINFMQLAEDGLENVRVTAVCDVAIPKLESNRKACADRQKCDVKGYQDYRDLLDNKDIDAVLIATPEHWHAQMSIDAIKAGKDVYVEKPMTLKLDDALRLNRETVNAKNFVLVGTQYMTLPKYVAAQKLIASGGIGHATFSQTSYCRNSKDGEWLYYAIDPRIVPGPNLDWDMWCGPLGRQVWDPAVYARWRRYRTFSTGIIGDLLVHQMTPLMMSVDAGWPTRVVATGGHYIDKAMENHDQVNIQVQFEKGHTMIIAGSTCNEQGLETMIRGQKGTIYLGGGSDMVMRPESLYADEVEDVREKFKGIAPHNAMRQSWLDSVRNRKPPVSPVDHATKVMVIVDLATRSMWEGKAFAFDPVSLTTRAI